MLGYVAIVQKYFRNFLVFHSRQGEACKDKIVPGKTPFRLTLRGVRLYAVLVCVESDSAQYYSHFWIFKTFNCRLHAVLAGTEFDSAQW